MPNNGAFFLAHWRERIEAAKGVRNGTSTHDRRLAIKHTFEEFLASILLEECFVDGGARQVVNHEVDNRLNLILCVACIIRNSRILLSTLLAFPITDSIKGLLFHSPTRRGQA